MPPPPMKNAARFTQNRAAFFLGLQVQGCSGPGTRNLDLAQYILALVSL